VAYEYDDAGNRTMVTYPGGFWVRYAYDAMDRLVEVRDPASSYAVSDFDFDGDVDLGDFGVFNACYNGPNKPPAQGNCDRCDFDDDGDVDLADFFVLQKCFNGPDRPPACP
jgi:YD repeat-containing protein